MNQIISWIKSNKAKVAILGFSTIGFASISLFMFLGNGHLNLSFEEMKNRLLSSENIEYELTVLNSTGTEYVTLHSDEHVQASHSDPMSLVRTDFVNPEGYYDEYLCEKKQEVLDLLTSNSVAAATSFVSFPTEADHMGGNISNFVNEQIIKFDNTESPARIVEIMRGAIRGESCTDSPGAYKLMGTSSKVYKVGSDDSFVYEYSQGGYFKRIVVVLADGPHLITITGFDQFLYEAWGNHSVDWYHIIKTAILKLYDK